MDLKTLIDRFGDCKQTRTIIEAEYEQHGYKSLKCIKTFLLNHFWFGLNIVCGDPELVENMDDLKLYTATWNSKSDVKNYYLDSIASLISEYCHTFIDCNNNQFNEWLTNGKNVEHVLFYLISDHATRQNGLYIKKTRYNDLFTKQFIKSISSNKKYVKTYLLKNKSHILAYKNVYRKLIMGGFLFDIDIEFGIWWANNILCNIDFKTRKPNYRYIYAMHVDKINIEIFEKLGPLPIKLTRSLLLKMDKTVCDWLIKNYAQVYNINKLKHYLLFDEKTTPLLHKYLKETKQQKLTINGLKAIQLMFNNKKYDRVDVIFDHNVKMTPEDAMHIIKMYSNGSIVMPTRLTEYINQMGIACPKYARVNEVVRSGTIDEIVKAYANTHL